MEHIIARIKEFIEKTDVFYIATCNQDGQVHLAVARELTFLGEGGYIVFKSWFCRKTLENIQENPNIAIAMYDSERDIGYQIIGKTVSKDVVSVLNGYAPELEKIEKYYPQEEHRLIVKLVNVMDLHSTSHSDMYLLDT